MKDGFLHEAEFVPRVGTRINLLFPADSGKPQTQIFTIVILKISFEVMHVSCLHNNVKSVRTVEGPRVQSFGTLVTFPVHLN